MLECNYEEDNPIIRWKWNIDKDMKKNKRKPI